MNVMKETKSAHQFDFDYLGEPYLEFRYNQRALDPKVGLTIFGPYDTDSPSHPKNISYGIIGTEKGIELSKKFFEQIQGPISSKTGSENPRLWPIFPGFQVIFNCHLPSKPTKTFPIDEDSLIESSKNYDPYKRAYLVTQHYLYGLIHLTELDYPLDVVFCIVPEIIYKHCRPHSYIKDGIGERISKKTSKERIKGQTDLFQTVELKMYKYSVDFRRQLKARAMEENINPPIQIIREPTLMDDKDSENFGPLGKSPLSDRAWNICTTMFYKSGGKPWKLGTAREGVCYVGIVFRKTDSTWGNKTACCAAQMFLDSGDGVVVRGDYGPWYSPERKQFHLNRKSAKKLLKKVLETYSQLEGKPLKEVFLHYRASINWEEFKGFRAACANNVKLVCINIRRDPSIRLYREGTRPILRSSFLQIDSKLGFLWTSGFKPLLGTYDGWETPVPIRIYLQYGTESLDQIATDILGLTKLNFNECKYGDLYPVTIGFSDAVAEILVSNKLKNPKPQFKYYI